MGCASKQMGRFMLSYSMMILLPPGGIWTFAYSPPNLLTPGAWHHLALRWDGNTVAIFVDGILRGETPYDPVPDTGLSYHGESVSIRARKWLSRNSRETRQTDHSFKHSELIK